jgi:hypothetical protein
MAVTEPALEAAATGDGSRPSAREHLLPSTAAAQETFLSDWFSHQLKITISMISQNDQSLNYRRQKRGQDVNDG